MKAVFILLLVIAAPRLYAQTSNPATELAEKIAVKMKDTLGLTNVQKGQVYDVNLQLHEAKMAKRQQYTGTDSLQIHIQRVENMRDSLYRTVLGEEKYQLYLEKKKNLVNNN
ncbi:MAG TPA: hypothetical protein VEB40_04890 [Flavipsychrobacter sp.]|nr:hypothetical protein [Flavipsychrobacter sp.]